MSDVLYPWGWLDDRPVPAADLTVWGPSPAVQYGMGLFEGLKAYPRPGGVGVVALREHMRRLFDAASASPFNFHPAIRESAAVAAVRDLLRRNTVREECYIRPFLYHEGSGHVALRKGAESPTRFGMYLQRWEENYLKPEGVRCTVSTILKPMYGHAQFKTSGNYVLCTEAKAAAIAAGYDDCILRDCRGFVAEAASENLVLEMRDERVFADEPGFEERIEYAPVFVEPEWEDAPILPGITARILRESIGPGRGLRFERRNVTDLDLARARGVLLTGTAAEVTHVRELDETVYNGGRPTREMALLINGYRDLCEGRAYQEWVTFVET